MLQTPRRRAESMSEDQGKEPSHSGGCLCGATRYEIRGALRPVVNCHCGQCRRWHGHFAAYSAVGKEGLTFTEDRGLAWHRSSDKAKRGFCRDCGSSLFWAPDQKPYVAVAAGTLDAPTGLETLRHIHAADKGDYYELSDGLEQLPKGMG